MESMRKCYTRLSRGLRKAEEKIYHNNRYSGRDSNSIPPEHEPYIITMTSHFLGQI